MGRRDEWKRGEGKGKGKGKGETNACNQREFRTTFPSGTILVHEIIGLDA